MAYNGIGPKMEGSSKLPSHLFRSVFTYSRPLPAGVVGPALLPLGHCAGHFFDKVSRRFVVRDLGEVRAFLPSYSIVFRESLSVVSACVPFEGESDSPSAAELLSCERGARAPATGGQFGLSGLYVTPGQSAMDDVFEWSIEKCEAEIC